MTATLMQRVSKGSRLEYRMADFRKFSIKITVNEQYPLPPQHHNLSKNVPLMLG